MELNIYISIDLTESVISIMINILENENKSVVVILICNILVKRRSDYKIVINLKKKLSFEWLKAFFYFPICLCHCKIFTIVSLWIQCNEHSFVYDSILDTTSNAAKFLLTLLYLASERILLPSLLNSRKEKKTKHPFVAKIYRPNTSNRLA